MSSILLVTSSPRGDTSLSTEVARELADRLAAGDPGSTIVHRDLAADPLPHVDADFAAGIYTPAEDRTPEQSHAVARSDRMVDELLAADTVIVATGMINFSVSSALKSWIDHVARAGRTFRYGETGPEGLAAGRKVYLVVASGGVYSQGPAASFNFAEPYLRAVLGFLGMTDVETVLIEGVAMGPEAAQDAVSKARDCTEKLAAAA
ncbi:FMN-dependent NADH-azoreductase [Kaustia mangrovi]|uniref:FMN dependent NADH:quinone oxidoreductase n=1 Tax=Kaustia mangrovi TaxID=2593653 RepID=A0A7S8C5V7_9HYPH|nr:FMN-dependent NADH-azoreductase [Kaustia mangrovi]QPC43970.1 FMN-dependent NADH-azoreductase [Kaustia mangrovi]